MRLRAFFTFMAVTAVIMAVNAGSPSDAAVQVDVVSDSGSKIVLEYRIDDYLSQPVEINGDIFQKISLPGEPVSKVPGAPELPHVSRSIIIPNDARMAVRVVSVSYEEVIARIPPSKGILYRTVDPDSVPYSFGAEYSENAFYPAEVATLADPYILRDHRGIVVRFNPFRFNPVSGVLRVYTGATIEISAVGTATRNVLEERAAPRARIEAFEDLYDAHFLNSVREEGSADYTPLDEAGDMLIICHDEWISNMSSFVTHKATKGITATVVGVSTIGNDPTSIKSYIQNIYDTSDLAFVLLVGDAAQVATPQASGGASDPSYSKLAGSDNYPDIIVGRFSAQTSDELDTQVERTIDYETLPAMNQDWFWKGTGIASAEGAGIGDEGQSDIQHQNEIRGWLLGAGYTEVDQIYDPGATDTMVANAVNAGRGIMNYTGHGSSTSWGSTGFNVADIDALVNDNELPFIIDVACVNGNFDNYSKCFAEAWMRATNNTTGEPTGAIGIYASSINQSWAPPMEGQDEINLLITDPSKPYSYYGTLCYAGSCSMIDAYGSGGVDMFNTWHIFGDPSLHVIGDPPQTHGLRVAPGDNLSGSGTAGGPVSPTNMEYTLTNLDETAMEYEVTNSEKWIDVSNPSGTIPPGGSVQVTVSFNAHASNCDNGSYVDNVAFVNMSNHDGDTTRPASLSIGSAIPLYDWNLESDPVWSLEGEWEFGVPTGSGGTRDLNPDPTSGATGSNVYGANLAGNISKAVGGPYYLTLGPLDLTGIDATSISYARWLNTVGPPLVVSNFQVSGDGTNWTDMWSSSSLIADAAWTTETFDISSTADGRGAVYMRWGYQIVDRLPKAGSGWNIDDIVLEGSPGSVNISLYVDHAGLTWSTVAGAIGYDVVRGGVMELAASGGDFSTATEACLGDDIPGTTLAFTDTPVPGDGYWFVVRGVSLNGPMTYQSLAGNQIGMRDDEIDASAVTCP